jgi:hypothetical protein
MSKCKKKVKCDFKYDNDSECPSNYIFDDDFCNVRNVLVAGVVGLCLYYCYSNYDECNEIKPNECIVKPNCYDDCNI